MKSVWVSALGCVTSVGLRTSVTMGSLLTGAQRFDDLEVLRPDGEPLTGAAVRLPTSVASRDRLGALASLALAECVSRADRPTSAPLFLATPQEQDSPGALALLSTLRAQHPEALDGHRSQTFAGGRSGALRALETALAFVQSGREESCYVGAADTLLDPVRLRVLLDEGRLIDGPGADGFIPGEGAVFLRLETRPTPDALAVIRSATFENPVASASHAPGLLLSRAARAALQGADLVPAQLSGLVHDASGPQAGFEEISLALGRLRFPQAAPLPTHMPALSVGETGAAGPLLCLATAAFFLEKDVLVGPTLALLQGEGGDRSAAVLVPANGH